MGCVLGQHDDSGKKEQVIYYLSNTLVGYETRMNPKKSSGLKKRKFAMDAHGSRTLKMNFQRDQSFPEFATARDRQIVRKLATRYVLAVRGTAL
ncbi:hypothetical protein MRB53_036584 [Persea americana]|nr:hypothetical protein MRB53_036758 [Persea americana]KAJ8613996.1 hypothetical protein MRB53_036722 [Persea americana]KAJ8614386.1 hypothetical protein MRB53_036584 [Persea americana]